MKTADQLLTALVRNHEEDLKKSLPYKDTRILVSLSKSISGNSFITENQSNLLIKIFKEHRKIMSTLDPEFLEIIESPLWSSPFRPQDTTRKIYTSKVNDDNELITVEFAFSASIRKKLGTLNKTVTGLVQAQSGRLFYLDLTEKNIVTIIDELAEFKFDVTEKLRDFYNTIKSWDKDTVASQFELTNITHDNFQKQITADLGINTAIDQNILSDRSVRYQYIHEKPEKSPENLTEKIATRTSTTVWVNCETNSLEDVIQSLIQLKRFPVLVVFDTFDPKQCVAEMTEMSEILERNRIVDDVGIYFRLTNDDNGKVFNNIIKERNYNCELTADTKVVGVQSGKIPKFLLTTNWKPMSVVSIRNTLRHSKTAVYASCCDLVIAYTAKEPIIENKVIWE